MMIKLVEKMRQGDQYMKLKEEIYEILIGESLQEVKHNQVGLQIKNLFEKDSKCDKLYEAAYKANRNLCAKLGVEELKEIETIFWSLDEIRRTVAMEMYEYGYQIAKNGENVEII